MSGSAPVVLIDSPAPHVARLLINRPEKRNAIDQEVRQSLIDALHGFFADANCRAIVFGGVGGVFSSGGDLPSMIGLSEHEARERMRHLHILCRLVANSGLPVVSAIEGVGAGAAVGLALLGDCIVVDGNSRLLFPFMKLGLTPDWGTQYSLPRRVGLSRAMQLVSDPRLIPGEEAYRIGLADILAADGEVMPAAIAKASALAALPAASYARMKERFRNPSASLDEELQREENDQAVLLLGDEFREGHAAFTEKRTADFLKIERERD